jgi:hypothetical protein
MTQPPPAHFKFVDPAPVDVILQSPCGQSISHEPVPLQRNVQPLPVHV